MNRLEKMMTKKKKKFYFDPMNTSQFGKMNAANNLFSKKNNKGLGKQESVRLRVYNTTLFEHIRDLVNSNYISEELDQLEVPILAVRMAGDLSVARVYWQASGNADSDDQVQAVLDKYTGRIRHELISLRVMGNVPRVCFLKDKAAANIAEIDRLLAAADFGADEDAENEAHPHDTEWNDRYRNDPYRKKDSSNFVVGDTSARMTKEDGSPNSPMKSYFAVDHTNILEQISSRKKQEESRSNVQEGFAPVTDSVERFKVLQMRKKSKKGKKDGDLLYRGQLQELSERDDNNYVNDNVDVDDTDSDYESEDFDGDDKKT